MPSKATTPTTAEAAAVRQQLSIESLTTPTTVASEQPVHDEARGAKRTRELSPVVTESLPYMAVDHKKDNSKQDGKHDRKDGTNDGTNTDRYDPSVTSDKSTTGLPIRKPEAKDPVTRPSSPDPQPSRKKAKTEAKGPYSSSEPVQHVTSSVTDFGKSADDSARAGTLPLLNQNTEESADNGTGGCPAIHESDSSSSVSTAGTRPSTAGVSESASTPSAVFSAATSPGVAGDAGDATPRPGAPDGNMGTMDLDMSCNPLPADGVLEGFDLEALLRDVDSSDFAKDVQLPVDVNEGSLSKGSGDTSNISRELELELELGSDRLAAVEGISVEESKESI